MGRLQKNDDQKSHEELCNQRYQVLYARRMYERQVFMDDLKQFRIQAERRKLKKVTDMVGPVWYQVLSVTQKNALDNLKESMHQDLIEGRPKRVAKNIRDLGIYPRPHSMDLMNCIFLGRKDPMEMLSLLFYESFGYPVSAKRSSYPLNARLLLTGIFYIGLQNMISSLDNLFRGAEKATQPTFRRLRSKSVQSELSPYLQKMVAVVPSRRKPKRSPPPTMPPLDIFANHYDEEMGTGLQAYSSVSKHTTSTLAKPSTMAMPLSQPSPVSHIGLSSGHQSQLGLSKQMPSSLTPRPQVTSTPASKPLPPLPRIRARARRPMCDKLAGVYNLKPEVSDTNVYNANNEILKKKRKSQFNSEDLKKACGISVEKKKKLYDPPHSPPAILPNVKYLIKGVAIVSDRSFYILEAITPLPPLGNLIHGGYAQINGISVNIHLGFRATPPPPVSKPCDCIEKWHDTVFDLIDNTKCTCGHRYDYYNEGHFPDDEIPFFHKPTRNRPFYFDYATIFETNEKMSYIAKEMKRIRDTESLLKVGEATTTIPIKEKEVKRKKMKGTSEITIEEDNAEPEEYLKQAMKSLTHTEKNTAVSLPDVYQTPELREWMRRRMHGPVTKKEKAQLRYKSNLYWQMFLSLGNKGYGHVPVPLESEFTGHTDWLNKLSLHEKFCKFRDEFKYEWYKSQARINNLLWPTMFPEEMPDKHFREIYFSYLQARVEDVQLMHPYCARESHDRKLLLAKRPHCQ